MSEACLFEVEHIFTCTLIEKRADGRVGHRWRDVHRDQTRDVADLGVTAKLIELLPGCVHCILAEEHDADRAMPARLEQAGEPEATVIIFSGRHEIPAGYPPGIERDVVDLVPPVPFD